jgi:hypothetical protein
MSAQRLTDQALDATPAPPTPRSRAWPSLSLMALRVTVSLHVLAMLAQPITAGRYLAGDGGAVLGHQLGARIVVLLCLVQVVTTVIFWWRGGGPSRLVFSGAGLLLAEMIEFNTGRTMAFEWHVPLGVLLFGAAIQVFRDVWSLTPPSPR